MLPSKHLKSNPRTLIIIRQQEIIGFVGRTYHYSYLFELETYKVLLEAANWYTSVNNKYVWTETGAIRRIVALEADTTQVDKWDVEHLREENQHLRVWIAKVKTLEPYFADYQ